MYYSNYYNVADKALAGGLLAGLGIFVIIMAIFGIGLTVFEVIAMAKLFKKAGKPGWAAIVPIYNIIILYEIIGYKWYYIFVSFLGAVPVIGGAVVLLFTMTMNIKLAKSFGQTTGYGIGLWLLNAVFVPIIAFSKDINYVGPTVKGDIDFNDLF